ncbi:tetratricopeptide repeat protein [Gallaecimonas sp. GXIMD4217]|uniref:tetratricopeptide repeat protein n=1 Tax=Gallaecimonas sp. GXIMD4217 TaxID=3131927 RepID=UPI00311B3CE7
MTKLASSLLAVLALSTGVLAMPSQAIAAEEAKPESQVVQVKKVAKRKTRTLSQSAGKKVSKAFDLFTEENYKGALDVLLDLDPRDGYDKAYVYRFIGTLYYYTEQHDKSLRYLKEAADMDVLNQAEQEGTLKQVGDMYAQAEKWRDAMKYYYKWMDFSGKEDPDVWVRIANAHYSLKELDKVIPVADKAIARYKKPNKNPYVLKVASYFERKMYKPASKVLEELVRIEPKEKRWWVQLATMYVLLNDNVKALATYDLAYKQGFINKETEAKALAQLFASQEVPYKSAKLQEEFLKAGILKADESSYSTLANTWHSAKELDKAIEYYGKAGEAGNNGKYFLKQGNLLLEQEKYQAAQAALGKAIAAGDLRQPGRAHLALAQAYFFQQKYLDAIKELRLAKKYDDARKTAVSWEGYVREEAGRKGVKL